MGYYQINLYSGTQQCFEAIDANIVVCEYDCVQLFFL